MFQPDTRVFKGRLAPPAAHSLSGLEPASLFNQSEANLLSQALSAGMIVTPNLDHLRLLAHSKAFSNAYRNADLVLNDSRLLDKLVYGGRVLCMPGSDLAPQLLARVPLGARVLIIGASTPVLHSLRKSYPQAILSQITPSMGYIYKRQERREIEARVRDIHPDLVLVCTGAPQSEILANQLKRRGCGATILCCGSALEMLTGKKARAPGAVQRAGMEWAWRFVGEPHTRARYVSDSMFLFAKFHVFLKLRLTGKAQFGNYCLSMSAQSPGLAVPAR